jgi:site-specific recombinase XerD
MTAVNFRRRIVYRAAKVSTLYWTGARVAELVQLKRRQLVADTEGKGGYVTLYSKHGSRTIRVGRRTWEALLRLAEGKAPTTAVARWVW